MVPGEWVCHIHSIWRTTLICAIQLAGARQEPDWKACPAAMLGSHLQLSGMHRHEGFVCPRGDTDAYCLDLSQGRTILRQETAHFRSINMSIIACYGQRFLHERMPGAGARRVPPGDLTILSLRHDVELFQHLINEKLLPDKYQRAAEVFNDVLQGVPKTFSVEQGINVDIAKIEPGKRKQQHWNAVYGRAVYVSPGSRSSTPLLARTQAALHNDEEIAFRQSIDFKSSCDNDGWIIADNVLTPAAAAQLRNVLENSAVYHSRIAGGRVLFSSFAAGLHMPIFLQLAEELQEAYPNLLGHHPLRSYWALKFDNTEDVQPALALHHDEAAMHVTLWLTPEEEIEGSLITKQARNGLQISKAEVSSGFDPQREAAGVDHRIGLTKGRQQLVVPYKANRAILFKATFLHATMPLQMPLGYRNRRISLNFLFGAPCYSPTDSNQDPTCEWYEKGKCPSSEPGSLIRTLGRKDLCLLAARLSLACEENEVTRQAVLATQRIVQAKSLWSTASLDGTFWIPGSEGVPKLEMMFYPEDKSTVELHSDKNSWNVTNHRKSAPKVWIKASGHRLPARCKTNYTYRYDKRLRRVRSATLREQMITFQGIILDHKTLLPLSHVRAVPDRQSAEQHHYFEPLLKGTARFADLLWARFARRVSAGGDLSILSMAGQWHKDTVYFAEGLNGALSESFFSCPGISGFWRQGLVEVEVIPYLAMPSHLWVASFGHWLSFELAAMLLLVPWLHANSSRKILIHPVPFAAQALDLLQVDSAQVLKFDPCKLYFAHELRVVSGLQNDMPGKETVAALRQWLLPYSHRAPRASALPLVLFVDRAPGSPRRFMEAQRKKTISLLHELCKGSCHVHEMMIDYSVSLLEQMRMHAQAAVVLTSEGFQAANVVWMKPSSIFAMVLPPNWGDGCAENLDKHIAELAPVNMWTYIPARGAVTQPIDLGDWDDFSGFLRMLFGSSAMQIALAGEDMNQTCSTDSACGLSGKSLGKLPSPRSREELLQLSHEKLVDMVLELQQAVHRFPPERKGPDEPRLQNRDDRSSLRKSERHAPQSRQSAHRAGTAASAKLRDAVFGSASYGPNLAGRARAELILKLNQGTVRSLKHRLECTRVSHDQLTLVKSLVSQGLPVLVKTKSFAQPWWADRELFLQRFGQEFVPVNNGRFDQNHRKDRPRKLQEWAEVEDAEHIAEQPDLVNRHVFEPTAGKIARSIRWAADRDFRPDLFSNISERPILSIGGQASATFFHSHAETWLHLVSGRKLWFLARPGTAEIEAEWSKPSVSPCEWALQSDEKQGSKLPKNAMVCDQHPGDLIYIPSDWLHATCNLEPWTLAVGAQGNIGHWPLLHRVVKMLSDRAAETSESDRVGAAVYKHHLESALANSSYSLTAMLEDRTTSGPSSFVKQAGDQPIHTAVRSSPVGLVRLLLQLRSQVEARDGAGNTPLHLAAGINRPELVQDLVWARASISTLDQHGHSPLLLASMSGWVNVVGALISARADINGASVGGHSPVHGAAVGGHVPVLQELLRYRASIEVRQGRGFLPIQLAETHGHNAVAQLLASRERVR